jgi:hypothetical protein
MKRPTFISRLLLPALALAVLAPLFAAEPPGTNAPASNAPATHALSALPGFGRLNNFFMPDYYDPPNQNQMKSLLRGAQAEPQPNGCVLIHELQLETYSPEGHLEMSVHAPQCLYNVATQTASSASHIEARSGDGHLLIEGEGFLWLQTNSTFTISNRVHTIIRQEPETLSKS